MREILFQPNLGCGICYEGVDRATSAASMHCCHHTHIVHHRCALQWYVKQRQQNHIQVFQPLLRGEDSSNGC